MNSYLKQLDIIDYKIKQELTNSDINAEKISQLVDTRAQSVDKLLELLEQSPEIKQSEAWQKMIVETETIVELMQRQTNVVERDLQNFQYGQRSLQQYKRFL